MGTGHCGEPCRRRALSLSASATKGEDLKVIHVLAFYLFAALVIASGALTIFARNPVHSVLWLIMAFFNAAGLMVLLQAEFIAMLLVIVYVGAVAVLFLFVVMMLDIDFAELRAGFVEYLPFGALVAILLVTEIVLGVGAWRSEEHTSELQLLMRISYAVFCLKQKNKNSLLHINILHTKL